jgi:transposase
MVLNDRPTCKDRHAAELILVRSARIRQRPNTLPQTCLLAQTFPCSRAADYRNLVIQQMVQMKNRVSGLLMESGVSYDKQRLHKMGYFTELFSTHEETSDSIRPLLRLGREYILRGQRLDRALISSLERDPLLSALEIGDYIRFQSVKEAISYCGLCSAEKSSADKVMRMPISKQRNKHIQHVLVEAANLAPRYSHELALLREKEIQRGNKNRATLGGSQEAGDLHARGRPQETGLRAGRRVGGQSSGA